MDKLSAVIITLNEERNIERCLLSLKDVADEIVVVDSLSVDRTKEICEKAEVRFIQESWKGYAETKNFANSLVTNDWILSIDADEEVDEQLRKEILEHKTRGFKGTYVLNRLTNYCGKWIKHSTWYPDKKVRIFPKEKARLSGEYVHEELELTEQLPQTELKGHLNHYSYYNYKEHRLRADKYSLLTAKKLNAAGKTVGPLKPFISSFGRFVTMFILNSSEHRRFDINSFIRESSIRSNHFVNTNIRNT